jgi:hypothetical protein
VSIQAEGALLISKNEKRRETSAVLFFDPTSIEGESQANGGGLMVGYTLCLISGIALTLMKSELSQGLSAGILSGLTTARNLLLEGFDATGSKEYRLPSSPFPDKLTFPVQCLSKILSDRHFLISKMTAGQKAIVAIFRAQN